MPRVGFSSFLWGFVDRKKKKIEYHHTSLFFFFLKKGQDFNFLHKNIHLQAED